MEHLTMGNPDYTQEELRSAVESLGERGLVLVDANGSHFSSPSNEQEGFYARIVEMFRFLLDGEVSVRVLGSPFYDSQINENLIAEIRRIQGGLPLSDDDSQEIIQLLRLSPQALARAIRPDPLIVTHRAEGVRDSDVDKHDRNYFLRQLYLSLVNDFRLSPLKNYFHEIRGLREVETQQKVIVKSEEGAVIQRELKERLGIGQLSEEFGGGYILVLVVDDAPQPWETRGSSTGVEDEQVGE